MASSEPKSKAALTSKLDELFGLDLRSLAVFRIGLALILLGDLIVRSKDLTAHYTDAGVLPRSLLTEELLKPWYWSVHLLSGSPIVQAILFSIAGFFALAMLVGYQTRLATIASWALLVSLHNRNPALTFAGDDALLAILFWSMFLPLGACYSIERALNTSWNKLPGRILSGATLGLTLQICYIYIFSAFFKGTSPTWSSEGSAVYYALSFDQYATGLGQLLLNLPYSILALFTFFTLWLELVGPLFIFIPFRNGFFRVCTIITFLLLHLGFALTLNIGIFPFVSAISWLVLTPSWVWNALSKRLYTPQRAGLRIYYDADCGFCKKVVHLIRTFLILPPETPLLMAQDDPSIYEDMEKQNSWVIVDWQGNRHFKFAGIIYVCSLSPILSPLVPILRWKPVMSLGTKFYETVASNRRTAGRFTRPFKFRSIEVRPSRPLNVVTLLLLVYITFWNVKSLNPAKFNRRTLNSLDWVGRVLRLQKWSIFAPSPPRDDGWYVMPGQLKDGREVDIYNEGASVSWEKPSLKFRNTKFGNMRWRTYMINLPRAIGKKLYPSYAQYLCRSWNAKHKGKQQVDNFEVYFMSERTVPPGQAQKVEKKRTWQQSCSDLPKNN